METDGRLRVPGRLKGRAALAAELLAAAGQDHVLSGFEKLPKDGRDRLAGQLETFDVGILKAVLAGKPSARPQSRLERVDPLPFVSRASAGKAEWLDAVRTGEGMIASGRVAAFTAAGGHGTRLGFEGPKGAFPIGPVTGRPLFKVFAQGLLAAGRRFGAEIPWVIMTSSDNHADTVGFFGRNGFFGLNPESVTFVKQASLPVFDSGWKMVMENPSVIMTAPDGHGGFWRAMESSGAFEAVAGRGCDTVFYFQVDNPLLSVPDSAFIGFHSLRGSRFSTKVVEKKSPAEKMGVLCRSEGITRIIEYSEVDEVHASRRDGSGRLELWAGNTANHVIDLAFARECAGRLPRLHAALKLAKPGSGFAFDIFKLESFIFDALPHDPSPLAFEAARAEEFGPVKASDGPDSPGTARLMLTAKYAAWLEAAGVRVPRGKDGMPLHPIEISPLTAARPEDLLELGPGRLKSLFLARGPLVL